MFSRRKCVIIPRIRTLGVDVFVAMLMYPILPIYLLRTLPVLLTKNVSPFTCRVSLVRWPEPEEPPELIISIILVRLVRVCIVLRWPAAVQ